METPTQKPGLVERLRGHRLTTTFVLLGTLSVGILAGSVLTHGVSGKEQAVDSSDARPLTVPDPVILSNGFSKIAKAVGPAVVNINTEELAKPAATKKGKRGLQRGPLVVPPGGDGSDDSQSPNDNMQDFFNHFFGGQGGQGGDDGDGGDQGSRRALGSGFIVDSRGYIITNNHVVDKADKIYVKLSTDPDGGPGDNGRPAKLIGVDKDTDIAVIKIDAPEPLPTIKLGNSDGAQVGDWVLAVGSPFALAKTVTAGIVSAKNRTIEGGQQSQFQRFIQTDAAINPGNSGGPLLNMNGEVIGINTAIYTQSSGYQGVGFAMPSNTVVDVYNQLIGSNHKVTRGWIGIAFQPTVSSATARVYGFKTGVVVSSVDPNGPAEKADLQTSDVITTIDGRQIKNGDDLVADISSRHPGTQVKIGYLRGGKAMTTVLTVGDRDKGLAARDKSGAADDESNTPDDTASAAKIGVTIRNVPPALASKMGIKGGVQIMSVKPGSFADSIALPPTWVITEINKKPVSNDQDFKAIVSGLKPGDDVVFVVHSPQDTQHGSSFIGGTLP